MAIREAKQQIYIGMHESEARFSVQAVLRAGGLDDDRAMVQFGGEESPVALLLGSTLIL